MIFTFSFCRICISLEFYDGFPCFIALFWPSLTDRHLFFLVTHRSLYSLHFGHFLSDTFCSHFCTLLFPDLVLKWREIKKRGDFIWNDTIFFTILIPPMWAVFCLSHCSAWFWCLPLCFWLQNCRFSGS